MDDGSKGGDETEGGRGGIENDRQSERDEEGEEEEAKCKAAIEVEKKVYKGSFQVICYR